MRAIDAVIALGQRAPLFGRRRVAVVSVWLLTWGTPSVAPLYPLSLTGDRSWRVGSNNVGNGFTDFVFRPLFRTSRTPFVDDSVLRKFRQ